MAAFVNTVNTEAWMAEVDKSKSLLDLVIPGTHDSMAFQMRPCIATPWSRCQGDTYLDQLASGIRYFDLRLDFTSEKLEFCHGIVQCGEPPFEFLQGLKSWSKAHLSEVVLLHFVCEWGRWPMKDGDTDYELLSERKANFHVMLGSVLSDALIRADSGASMDLPLFELLSYGNIVLVRREQASDRSNIFSLEQPGFSDYSFEAAALWFNKQTWSDLAGNMGAELKGRDRGRLHVLKATLTPVFQCQRLWNPTYLCTELVQRQLNKQVVENLEPWAETRHGSINIIELDFSCDQGELIEALLSKQICA
eukprot:gb/GFBE01061983.1/.p1 GENE.gb/GFBE01061983.1/~~gb/GFBE01061983.1/.p1  ORF type:complete len:307 (+),score=69.39 gb/GFBE01061983.1/:1-921(+)